jgi:hypothetical protein
VKTINIDHFIELLKRCKEEGCTEIIFKTESTNKTHGETWLVIMQDDKSVILTSQKL